MHGPYRIVFASIVVLKHGLREAELVWRILNVQDVLRAHLDVMRELYFPPKQLVEALVRQRWRDVHWRLNEQAQLEGRDLPGHRQDLVF
jgi:hypothetical protein